METGLLCKSRESVKLISFAPQIEAHGAAKCQILFDLLRHPGASCSTSRPRLRNRCQARHIDLGIDCRRIQASMPQYVGDLFQAGTTMQHPCGRGMTQSVWTV